MRKSKKSAPFSPEYQYFCRLLREARENARFTQMDLAKRLRKPQSYISKYETGERRIDVIEYLRIARAIRIEPLEVIRELSLKFKAT